MDGMEKADRGAEKSRCYAAHQRLCMACPAGRTIAVSLRGRNAVEMRCVPADDRRRNAVRWLENLMAGTIMDYRVRHGDEAAERLVDAVALKPLSSSKVNPSMREPIGWSRCETRPVTRFFLLGPRGWLENHPTADRAATGTIWTGYCEPVPAGIATMLNRLTVELGTSHDCPCLLEHEILAGQLECP